MTAALGYFIEGELVAWARTRSEREAARDQLINGRFRDEAALERPLTDDEIAALPSVGDV
jgi:hypothetical protein